MIHNRFFIALGKGLYDVQTNTIVKDYNNIVQIKNDLMINRERQLYIVEDDKIIKAIKMIACELLEDNYAILTDGRITHYYNKQFIFFTPDWLSHKRIKKIERHVNNEYDLVYYIVLTDIGELYLCNVGDDQSTIANYVCIRQYIIDFSTTCDDLVTIDEHNKCIILKITPHPVRTRSGFGYDRSVLYVSNRDDFDGFSKRCYIVGQIIIDIENNNIGFLCNSDIYPGWRMRIMRNDIDLSTMSAIKKIVQIPRHIYLLTENGCVYSCDRYGCYKCAHSSYSFVDICVSKLSHKLYNDYSSNSSSGSDSGSDSDSDSNNDNHDYVTILGLTINDILYDLVRNYIFSENFTLKVKPLVKNANNITQQ
jgi:hypothetical protein